MLTKSPPLRDTNAVKKRDIIISCWVTIFLVVTVGKLPKRCVAAVLFVNGISKLRK